MPTWNRLRKTDDGERRRDGIRSIPGLRGLLRHLPSAHGRSTPATPTSPAAGRADATNRWVSDTVTDQRGGRRRVRRRNPSTHEAGPETVDSPHSLMASVAGDLPAQQRAGEDFQGRVEVEYCPVLDGRADPGEIVWAWVPYEEDPTQGKDRPVLVVGRDERWLLVLMLSSSDRANNPGYDDEFADQWMDIGSGPWDRKGRPSEVRLDRVIRIAESTVRREGAIMEAGLFHAVTDRMTEVRSAGLRADSR